MPMHSFKLHETRDAEQTYSRLLDARWAELALSHLRNQMDFAEKREKLARGLTATLAHEADEEKPNAKAKAKQGARKPDQEASA